MKRKVYITVLFVFSLATVLSACSMPAPRPALPASTPTQSGELPFVVPTNSDLVNDILNQTQTAIAKGAQPVVEGTAVPQNPNDQAGGGSPDGEATPDPAAQSGGGAPQATAVRRTARPQVDIQEPERPARYVVQKGDHIFCLARRFNVAPADLLAQTGGNQNIYPGQSLNVPQSSSWPSNLGSRSLRAHPATYTVLAGDTLNKIACMYGDVYPESIAQYNGLGDAVTVAAGTVLDIP